MNQKIKSSFRIAYDPVYAHPLPAGHRFPMIKYELIPGQLIHEGTITENDLFRPSVCQDEIICLAHDAAYLEKLNQQQLSEREQRHIGFPQSPMLTLREKTITQGTIDCARWAMQYGVALNVAGGTHHAFADRGEGFCLLNDFAVASRHLLSAGLAGRILIIDLDVHQGNGTAKIFEDEPAVFTFSMHGAHNYPFRKEKSDLDIPLPDGIGDDEYLSLLSEHLSRLIRTEKPDLAFFLSGVDVLGTDKYGKLRITMDGCRKRDEIVFRSLSDKNIPCAVSMGGGYSPDHRTIVEAHCQTFRAAREIYGLWD
jgi:acetoin utilization deacetylase AcuC-like enzyme